MNSEPNGVYPRVALGDLVENHDGRRVPVKEIERRPGAFPYYGASGIVDCVDSFLFEGEFLLVAEDGENLRTRKLPVAFMASGRFWVNNHAHVLRGNERAATRYLHYALQVADIRSYLTGTTMPKLTQGNLHRIPVPCPTLDEQRRIAAVLGALDDKIDLNRRMNATLEAMARAIFKSWFVDFDGHDDLVESEIGPVPRGWSIAGIDSVADSIRDGVDPWAVAPDTPYVGLEHVPQRQGWLEAWGTASTVDSGKARFRVGDVLFGKLRPYFHKVVVAPVAGICSTDILVVRPRADHWRGLVFSHLFSDAMIAHATALSDGTKMPRTSWDDLGRREVAIPPRERAEAFERVVGPLLHRVDAAAEESRTLAALRDTLLPRLLSGELRVPAAEALASEAS
jgi:type I restriction enzyme S subunit